MEEKVVKTKESEIDEVAENKILEEKSVAIKKEIQKSVDLNLVDEIIKNNELEFEFENETYKIVKPSYKQRLEVNEKKLEKYNSLLQEKDDKGNFKYKSEDELKVLYKQRGIDIEDMDFQIMSLEVKKKNYYLKLGKLLENKADEKDLQKYRDEITKINDKEQLISFKKTQLMESSLESQIFVFVYSYFTYLLTVKLNKETKEWERAWNSYDEFIEVKEELVNKAAFYVSVVIRPNMDL